ncbi:MAG TPA: hypothetical protein VGW78_04510 [Candidatus Babeliales bacterium]|jgi:hypothetical protein|nr:hypothetical protein [Candidatus Babeliales bacterium]
MEYNTYKTCIYTIVLIGIMSTLYGSDVSINQEKKHGSYALFKQIQTIRKIIAPKVAEESTERGHISWVESGEKGWPDTNPCYHQTKEGMYLTIGSYPNHIGTPWGEVMLYGSGSSNSSGFKPFTLHFMKNFTLAFIKNKCQNFDNLPFGVYESDKKNIKFYKVDAQNNETEIPRESLKDYEGKDTLIQSNLCGCNSLYEILAVQGQPVPKLEQFKYYKEFRSYEDVKSDWQKKQEQYDAEQSVESAKL